MAGVPDYDVVIIGAGISGVAAARALHAAGRRAVVLEAANRVGGRIRTDEFRGTPFEAGAEFIHGSKAATWPAVHDLGLPTLAALDRESRSVIISGKLQLPAVGQALSAYIGQAPAPVDTGLTVAAWLDRFVPDPALRRVAYNRYGDYEAADAELLNAAEFWDGERLYSAGHENFVFTGGGYERLVRGLAEGLDIRLDEPVIMIAKAPGAGVTVVTTKGEYAAAAAVVTVSLGGLRAGQPAFDPALPAEYRHAVNGIGFGNSYKLVVFLDRPLPFPGRIVHTDNDFSSWWPRYDYRPPAVVGFFGGNRAAAVANRRPEQRHADAMVQLQAVYGPAFSSEMVRGMHGTHWRDDPLSLGSYSYSSAGAHAFRRLLAQPLWDGALVFAGEAVNARGHYATVHGAYEVGLRTGARLARSAVRK